MNTDIRLSIGFRDHHKVVKLHKLRGEAGISSLVTLWAYTAAYRHKGILYGMDLLDVEIHARWIGENGAFVKTLHDLRLIDCPTCKPDDSWEPHEIVLPVAIHDWEDWQPWAFHADERSEIAREKAKKRWEKEKAKRVQGGVSEEKGKRYGCKQHKKRVLSASITDAEAPKIDAPSPSPSPKILKTLLSESGDSDSSPSAFEAKEGSRNRKGPTPGEIRSFFDMWNAEALHLPEARELNESRKRKIRIRLRERSLEEWGNTFKRMNDSPFLRGESGNGTFRADLDWIIANEGNAVKVLEGRYDDRGNRRSTYEGTAGRKLERVT